MNHFFYYLRHIRAQILDFYIRKKKIVDTSVCIISNNCWASMAFYQRFNIPYNTPTVGLFISDTDFIKFISDLPYYLNQTLQFISPERSPAFTEVNFWGKGSDNRLEYNFPVAMIGDVTLWFMHYKSKQEATEKWERRKKRVNLDNLLIKWSQRYTEDMETVHSFLKTPHKRKIGFVDPNINIDSPKLLKLNGWKNLRDEGGDEIGFTGKTVNTIEIINRITKFR